MYIIVILYHTISYYAWSAHLVASVLLRITLQRIISYDSIIVYYVILQHVILYYISYHTTLSAVAGRPVALHVRVTNRV